MNIPYPNITGKTPEERQRQLENWARQLVDQLNYLLAMLEKNNGNGG